MLTDDARHQESLHSLAAKLPILSSSSRKGGWPQLLGKKLELNLTRLLRRIESERTRDAFLPVGRKARRAADKLPSGELVRIIRHESASNRSKVAQMCNLLPAFLDSAYQLFRALESRPPFLPHHETFGRSCSFREEVKEAGVAYCLLAIELSEYLSIHDAAASQPEPQLRKPSYPDGTLSTSPLLARQMIPHMERDYRKWEAVTDPPEAYRSGPEVMHFLSLLASCLAGLLGEARSYLTRGVGPAALWQFLFVSSSRQSALLSLLAVLDFIQNRSWSALICYRKEDLAPRGGRVAFSGPPLRHLSTRMGWIRLLEAKLTAGFHKMSWLEMVGAAIMSDGGAAYWGMVSGGRKVRRKRGLVKWLGSVRAHISDQEAAFSLLVKEVADGIATAERTLALLREGQLLYRIRGQKSLTEGWDSVLGTFSRFMVEIEARPAYYGADVVGIEVDLCFPSLDRTFLGKLVDSFELKGGDVFISCERLPSSIVQSVDKGLMGVISSAREYTFRQDSVAGMHSLIYSYLAHGLALAAIGRTIDYAYSLHHRDIFNCCQPGNHAP